MGFRRFSKVGIWIACGVLLGFLVTFIPQYKGDGNFVDHGLFRITERYSLTFDEFQFQEGKLQKNYKFKGLPKIPMTLLVRINPSLARENRYIVEEFLPVAYSLESSGVEVGVTLTKDGNNILSIPVQSLVGDWVLSSWYFWNQEFSGIKFNIRSEYELIFFIETQEKIPEPITIQLQLRSKYGVMF
ncbi:hypothetical protein IQ254_24315 [Nodosilinea sp. LEGE 07088]|uniref:hypothetical protein n=1 Tax=Nodosilinea sp. LEGE 07088 TaxID=2777968 RepID=UPI001881CB53|nr:hypothetical protein [Nodosilinea sp. LEGE 07088]MBE9140284.1 hypothetical protein [Nodosilinea sp. LEGE 07088]